MSVINLNKISINHSVLNDKVFPRHLEIDEHGVLLSASWYSSVDSTRDSRYPTVIGYYSNGVVRCRAWVVSFDYHSIHGPALLKYNKHGRLAESHYYLGGRKLSKTDWLKNGLVKRIIKNNAHGIIASDVSF